LVYLRHFKVVNIGRNRGNEKLFFDFQMSHRRNIQI
jgi:hypothetical protein